MRTSLVILEIPLNSPNEHNITVGCFTGTINLDLNYTQFGLMSSYRSAQMAQTYYDISCTNFDGFAYSLQECKGKSSCDMIFKPYWIKSDCQDKIPNDKYSGFLKVQCKSNKNSLILSLI